MKVSSKAESFSIRYSTLSKDALEAEEQFSPEVEGPRLFQHVAGKDTKNFLLDRSDL